MQPSEDEQSPDIALVASALERPSARYLAWADRPDIADALLKFSSERDIRKTGRLDLVTWVQYICAFGYPGPSEEAWASLFAACRVLPMLATDNDTLREHEIAVLLAYAKIKPDNGDTMTPAQLVKHRIKPAVLGRTVSRTPGILHHLRTKFENWALGPFTDMFCEYCVTLCGPSSYMPGIDDMPTTPVVDIGDSIRECADAHASTLLKTWGGVMSTVLDLENYPPGSTRRSRFEQKLHEKRKYMYQHIFIKISEHWFNLTQQRSFIPDELDTLQYRRQLLTTTPSEPIPPSHPGKVLIAMDKPDTKLTRYMKKVISSPLIRRTIPPWCTVTTHITICELHQPSRYGQAGLDFVQSDDIERNLVRLISSDQVSSFTPSKANVRIGSFDAPNISEEVKGVPPSQMCRALRLELAVGVLAPHRGSTRPQFQVTSIREATWVELKPHEDQCVERDPVSEMGIETDTTEDKATQDRLHRWFGSSGIGKYLALGSGCHWETFDLCEGMTNHNMVLTVPEDLLRKVRLQSKVAEQTGHSILPRVRGGSRFAGEEPVGDVAVGSCSSIDMDVETGSGGSEQFVEPCWIDCHSGARLTYIAPPGVELFAASPEVPGIFGNSPFWKSRAP